MIWLGAARKPNCKQMIKRCITAIETNAIMCFVQKGSRFIRASLDGSFEWLFSSDH